MQQMVYFLVLGLLRVPMGTPKLAMKWDFGMLAMKFRIMVRKLTFVNSIQHMDEESLAKQVLREQTQK